MIMDLRWVLDSHFFLECIQQVSIDNFLFYLYTHKIAKNWSFMFQYISKSIDKFLSPWLCLHILNRSFAYIFFCRSIFQKEQFNSYNN